MSAIVTLRGRLGADPVTRKTNSGADMVTASLAVSLPTREGDDTQWFQLLAFGRTAEVLGKHAKGDALAIMGNLQLNVWTSEAGEERRDLQVVVEAIMTPRRAYSVSNGTKKVKKEPQAAQQKPEQPVTASADFDDDLGF